jgi:hypothetical protein
MDGVSLSVLVTTDVAGGRELSEQRRAGQRRNHDDPLQSDEPKELTADLLVVSSHHLHRRTTREPSDRPEDQPVVRAGGGPQERHEVISIHPPH